MLERIGVVRSVFFVLLVNAACFLNAQQLTLFAVVDMLKIYTAFFRDSRAVREFEERSAKVQADIDRITKEIQDLKSRQVDAVMR
ncbi:MAG: OmpH family outer membrane protein, partial [Treponema sp.]|nr:OmpH family outer membrane protein [Treponema sp.]